MIDLQFKALDMMPSGQGTAAPFPEDLTIEKVMAQPLLTRLGVWNFVGANL